MSLCNRVLVFLFIYFLNEATSTTPAISEGRTGWPGYTYYPQLQGWLKLHTEPTDYHDARIKCHMEDALMAAEWNWDFKAALVGLMPRLSSQDQSHDPALYSSAQVTFSDGVYKYVKGEPIVTISDIVGMELCIVFFANGTTGEVDCRQQYPFVCYAPVPACGENETSAKYDLTCAGYKYSSETGHCYKYNSQTVNWTTAYEACRNEGAYLAIVNSNAEAQYLKDFIHDGRAAAIGFYYWKPTKSWWTVKGQTIEQAGFSTWQRGKPTPNDYGGFLYSSGKFYSHILSYTVSSYICEKDPIWTLS